MLEQYADHPFAYDKIVLVSPGFTAAEIEKLHFKHIVWPSVFGVRAMSKEEAFRRETTLRKQRVAKGFAYKGVFSRTLERNRAVDFRDLLMAMVPKGSVIKATSTFNQSGGPLVKGSADFEAGSRARSVTFSLDEDVD